MKKVNNVDKMIIKKQNGNALENTPVNLITNEVIERKMNHPYQSNREKKKSIKSYPKKSPSSTPWKNANDSSSFDRWNRNNDQKINFRGRIMKAPVLSPSFESMHEACKARRYKVHSPGCLCPKMKQVRSSIISNKSKFGNESYVDYSGTIIVQKEKQNECRTNMKEIDPISIISKCLVVVPDIKIISHIYASTKGHDHSTYRTNQISFRKNIFLYERILRDHIFPSCSITGSATHNKNKKDNNNEDNAFKISCANCMLQIEPNGFVCLTSTYSTLHNLLAIRDTARIEANKVLQQGYSLHADHADYLCVISSLILLKYMEEEQSIKFKRKKSDNQKQKNTKLHVKDHKYNATSEVKEQLLDCMMNEGIPVSYIDKNIVRNNENEKKDTNMIKIQHHLESLLLLLKKKIENEKKDPSYWLIIVYDDTKKNRSKCWSLDLPGGKRHLSESSWQGAVRETREESSVMIDHTWIVDQVPSIKDGTSKHQENTYFILKSKSRPNTLNAVFSQKNEKDHQDNSNQTLRSEMLNLHL